MRIKIYIATIAILFAIVAHSQNYQYPFQNPSIPIDARVENLLSLMTPQEKVSQVMYSSPAIERLGIPQYNWWNECLHGVARAGRATVFPQAIGLAATFDDELIFQVADAISTEARAKYNEAVKKDNRVQYLGLTFWTPNINIFRDPRWGRGQETYGEDPYLTGRMGTAFVKGLQGNDPHYLKAAACAKHFAVHSGPEKIRHEFDATPSEIDLRETYLPAFRTLVTDAHVEAIMCAYNRLYESPCCGSTLLLNDILRKEWGFQGHIVTDCWALDDIWLRHKTVKTEAEAAAMGVEAGANLECGNLYQYLPEAIEKGYISEKVLDTILTPTLRTRFKLGMFDPQTLVPWSSVGPEQVDSPAHRELAYKTAVESMVLLQNRNNILPLNRDSIPSILVTGPTAADIQSMVGNYNGWSGNIVTFLEGITSTVDAGTVVDYSLGCQMTVPGNYQGFWEARMSDVVIVCLGNSKFTEGEEGEAFLNPNGGDRSDINLPQSQREYIKLLREKVPDKPIIAVITGGSAIALQDVLEVADAVIMAWYPGEEGGNALADIIFGKVNPSGKLPVTFYRSVDDLPPFDDYSMQGRTYKYFKGDPLFPFGFGLSYSNFSYSSLKTNKEVYKENETIATTVNLENASPVAGDEVVMLYAAMDSRPDEKYLVGFERVHMNPGEKKVVTMNINLADMYQWNEADQKYFVENGKYHLFIISNGKPALTSAVDIIE